MNTPWKISIHQLNKTPIPLMRNCGYCGNPFQVPVGRAHNKQFCDKDCQRAMRTIRNAEDRRSIAEDSSISDQHC